MNTLKIGDKVKRLKQYEEGVFASVDIKGRVFEITDISGTAIKIDKLSKWYDYDKFELVNNKKNGIPSWL